MKSQSIVLIKDIIFSDDKVDIYYGYPIEKGAKELADRDGFCICPPILSIRKDQSTVTYDVVYGSFQVACAKLASKNFGTKQLNCYIADTEEAKLLLRQVPIFMND